MRIYLVTAGITGGDQVMSIEVELTVVAEQLRGGVSGAISKTCIL